MDDPFAIAFAGMVVDSYGEKGLGLGSEMSQLLALANLNGLDHAMKEKLHAKVYVRYMDDGRAVFPTKEDAKKAVSFIAAELAKCNLALSKKKTRVFPLRQPITFLGWRYFLKPNGRIVMKPRKGKIKHQKDKLRRMFAAGVPTEAIEGSLQCMLASLELGDAYREKKILIDCFKEEKTKWQKN